LFPRRIVKKRTSNKMAIPSRDFQDMVAARRDSCVKFKDDKQSGARREALQFYRGDNLSLYGNSGDGLSTVVSRDVMESIESMLPGLVKPFVAGEETVRFDPTGPEDEEAAKQATEYVNYLFQNHNNAFRVVYDLMKDGLQYRLGVAKVVHEETDDKELTTYQGLDELGVQALEADDDHEIVGDIIQAEDGTFEVRCSKSVKRSTFRVYVIAPEEFLYEERLASLDDARLLGHRATKPIGDFIAMGLPKKKVMALKSDDGTDETENRFEQEDRRDILGDEDDLARLVTIDELYVRCDYENTGALSWRKVFMAGTGSDILLNEEADDHPYECWTPIPIPHKLVGLSAYDLTRDIQMQKTALVRESLNALYLANRPQREVVEGQVNFEDLLNPEIGGLVRVKQPGQIREIATGGANVMQQSAMMIEYLDGTREQRTGSTRYNQGMDANSLNKTATGISIIQNASTQRAELIARQFAESAMKGIFRKLLGLVCRHGDKKQVIRLRGQWVEMDPSDWKTGYDMSVAVGLGSGNRDQQVGQLNQLIALDREIIQLQGGVEGPILTLPNIYEKLKRLVEAMGLKGVDNYYTDPEKEGEQPQQPEADPEQNAEVQKFQAETERDMEKAKLEAETKLDVERIKAAKDLILAGFTLPPEMMGALMGIDEPMDAPQPPLQPEMPPEAMQPPLEPEMMPDEAYMPTGEAFVEGDEFDNGMMPPEFEQ
jgi:hypothetical protein